ncbi:hypothetical protein Pcinc_021588 [Petrolisthes cinctipes]|uniref:Uncharacterized protein n=1 Tax=Petrolisthes cinctipes TaxID=88211 RepID=A0AAE1KI52_PETCI|nr:hypothetical protein Pcinc_021588 [Petrolisthes cinctipes]
MKEVRTASESDGEINKVDKNQHEGMGKGKRTDEGVREEREEVWTSESVGEKGSKGEPHHHSCSPFTAQVLTSQIAQALLQTTSDLGFSTKIFPLGSWVGVAFDLFSLVGNRGELTAGVEASTEALRYYRVEAARASVTRDWPSERLPLNCAKREGPHGRPGVHLVPPLSPARPAQSVRPAPALVTVPSHHARHPHFSGVCSDAAAAAML